MAKNKIEMPMIERYRIKWEFKGNDPDTIYSVSTDDADEAMNLVTRFIGMENIKCVVFEAFQVSTVANSILQQRSEQDKDLMKEREQL